MRQRRFLVRNHEQPRKCQKRAYPTEANARAILSQLIRKGREEAMPYKCPKCGTWHLTSRWD